MKSYIYRTLLFVIAFGFYFTCAADTTCKISDEGDSVEVMSALINSENNTVDVSIGNDSSTKAANVSVTVEVDYSYGNKRKYTGKTQVGPQQTKDLSINIDKEVNGRGPKSVTVVSITGSKCL